jgi:hypothetical protein
MLSEFEPVVLAPLLHYLHDVLRVRVACIFQHLDHLNQLLLVLLSGDNTLEDTNGGAPLALPELRVSIEPFQNIKRLH